MSGKFSGHPDGGRPIFFPSVFNHERYLPECARRWSDLLLATGTPLDPQAIQNYFPDRTAVPEFPTRGACSALPALYRETPKENGLARTADP